MILTDMEPQKNVDTLPLLNNHVLVEGGSYKGSTGVLLKEMDCRYKIRLVSGREVYFWKKNVKFDDDAGV